MPARIYDLPFLSEQGRRNILGANAARIFRLEDNVTLPLEGDLRTEVEVEAAAGGGEATG